MSLFEFANWFTTLFAGAWLLQLFRFQRYLFVKPGMLLLAYTHFLFQWPIAITSRWVETFLPLPWDVWLTLNIYMLVGLGVAQHTFRGAAREAFERLRAPPSPGDSARTAMKFVLAAIVGVIVMIYLESVPFEETGLYALLTLDDPAKIALAREFSLKLHESATVKYLYAIMSNSVGPLLVGLCVLSARDRWRAGSPIAALRDAALVAAVIVASSLSGARGFAFGDVVVVMFVLWFGAGLPIRPGAVIIAFILALSPVLAFTMLREAKDYEFELAREAIGFVLERIFLIPSEVGIWYAHYFQTRGGFGIAAVPKLAALLGIDPIHAPNVVALIYELAALESSSNANGGYLLTYYGYFGPASILLSLVALWITDATTLLYRHMHRALLLPLVAVTAYTTTIFISADFHTALVTHGFAVTFVVALSLGAFFGGRLAQRTVSAAG